MMIETLLKNYDWFDHPDGPKFVETQRDAHRSIGHWLFLPGSFSSFHRVTNNEEIWAVHIGRLLVHVVTPEGEHQIFRLGLDIAAGERPVITVPMWYWQAAEIPVSTPFAFGTNVCAPGFLFTEFQIADRATLLAEYPTHTHIITRLTRV